MDDANFYRILNVDENSTLDEIKRQYRTLALRHHPDRDTGNDELFKRINEAYETLSDEEKRREYDRSLYKYEYEDVRERDTLNALFKDVMNRTEEQQKVVIRMDLEDVLYGTYKKYKTKHTFACAACKSVGIENPEKNTIQCRECFGKGRNPTLNFLSCLTCNGRGIFVINNRPCKVCKGSGVTHDFKQHSIYLKPGTLDKEIITVSKTVVLFVEHRFAPTEFDIAIRDNAVHLTIDVTLMELLTGFDKRVAIGQERMSVYSTHAFDPSAPVIVRNDGLMDFVIHFNLVFDSSNSHFYTKLSKSLREIQGGSSLPDLDEPDSLAEVKLVNVHQYAHE